LLEIMVERLLRLAAVPRQRGRTPLVALLKAADAPEVAADAAGEVGELDLQRWKLIEQPAVDDAHGRDHQGEFPAEHASEIVGVELRPRDDLRQRMDEDVEAEIGRRAPERTQRLGIERLPLQLRRDDHAREAKLDRAAFHLRRRFEWLQDRDMGKPDETA